MQSGGTILKRVNLEKENDEDAMIERNTLAAASRFKNESDSTKGPRRGAFEPVCTV
jgi:hypothetical protein